MSEHSDSTDNPQVSVLSCIQCEGPVASTAGKCHACGTPLTGKEFAYIPRQHGGSPDIAGMVKWWAVLSVAIFVFSGFSMGMGSSLLFTAVTAFYLVRILRAYYL
ncbi:MAG: hypothetical protein V2J89_04285 [Halieaceae bacterium]|jgi:hypothetical protein|nr:hypothetical protein [Halieaceae bacterium]